MRCMPGMFFRHTRPGLDAAERHEIHLFIFTPLPTSAQRRGQPSATARTCTNSSGADDYLLLLAPADVEDAAAAAAAAVDDAGAAVASAAAPPRWRGVGGRSCKSTSSASKRRET